MPQRYRVEQYNINQRLLIQFVKRASTRPAKFAKRTQFSPALQKLGCQIPPVRRGERWRTRRAPSEAAEAEAVRTGGIFFCETNPIFEAL